MYALICLAIYIVDASVQLHCFQLKIFHGQNHGSGLKQVDAGKIVGLKQADDGNITGLKRADNREISRLKQADGGEM